MMEITDKEFKELAEKEAIDMWGHYSTGELHRAYFIDAYTKGFREALKQVKNNGVLDDVSNCLHNWDYHKLGEKRTCFLCGKVEMT